ncbi:MAG: hypothetical protein V4733_07310 [Verrucomicrobiota bacterium]
MKRIKTLPISRSGILRASTLAILAGGAVGTTGCDSREKNAAEARTRFEAQSRQVIEQLDSQRDQLLRGEVPNNFHIPGVGYYHAAARTFAEHSYNFQKDGRWFVNNAWGDAPGPENVPASRPLPEALARVDQALAKQEKELDAAAGQTGARSSSGPGLGTALAMYWLLSGSRGSFTPGSGFTRFGQRAPHLDSMYREQEKRRAGTVDSRSSRPYGGSTSTAPSSRGGFGTHGGRASS